MRFSIKSRVESLIKRGRILAAIRKLQHFTKTKADYRQTYNTLNELESKFIQIERDSKSGVLDYATFDRERSKIRSAVLDINNEIVELKETKDRKFLWAWIWAIITGLLIPTLFFVIPLMREKTEHCPVFDDSQCKLLIFKFPVTNIGGTAERISQLLNRNESYNEKISSAVHLSEERAPTMAFMDQQIKACDADFAISGYVRERAEDTYIEIIPYSKEKGDLMETSLASYVDEIKDTVLINEDPGDIAQQEQFDIMMKLIACWTRCIDCVNDFEEIEESIARLDPDAQVNVSLLFASYYHQERNYESSESLLSNIINSLTAPIKAWAFRGKVRDDLKKYEPAFQDYSYYLDEKPGNHNVRLKRFKTIYNLLTTSVWQDRFGGYVDVAFEDMNLLEGNILNDQFRSVQRMMKELIKMREDNTEGDDPSPNEPEPVPAPIEKCDFVFNVKSDFQENLADAVVTISGLDPRITNRSGMVEFINIPCNDLNGKAFTVEKSGFELYRSQVTEERLMVVLETLPEEVPMCVFRGEVVDENGRPVFSASVAIDGLPRMRTDREGIFSTASKPCAELEGRHCTIVANGFETYRSEISNMEMRFIMVTEKPIVPVPEPETCIFSGYIMGDKGPISGAIVDIYRIAEMKTNTQGYFQSEKIECDRLIGNKYAVEASGYERITEIIRGNQLKVEHILNKKSVSYVFRGNVINTISKEGLPASIILNNETLCKSDKSGSFSCNYESQGDSGRKQFTFRSRGYHDSKKWIDITNSNKSTVRLIPTRISGKIIEGNKPVFSASVSIEGLENRITDKYGKFTFSIPKGFKLPKNIQVRKKGYNTATVPIKQYQSISIEKTPTFSKPEMVKGIKMIPMEFAYLHVYVFKQWYNEKTGKREYVPAVGATVIVDKQVKGKTDKDGKFLVNMTGRLNKSVSIDVKGIDQISAKKLPTKIKFTKDGQKLNLRFYELL